MKDNIESTFTRLLSQRALTVTHTHMTCTIQSDIPYVNAIHGRANKNTFLTIAYKEVCAIEIDQLSAKENT